LPGLKSNPVQLTASLKQFYPVRTIDNQNYIGALIKVSPAIDEKAMTGLGVKINTRVNDVWSVMIPLTSLEKAEGCEGPGLCRSRLQGQQKAG